MAKKNFKNWFVYIIKCVDGSLYTGYTNDLQKRFEKHKSGKGAKYTRSHAPESIVFFQKYVNKIKAQQKEREIKKMTREEKLIFLKNQSRSG